MNVIGGLVYRDPSRTVEPVVLDSLLPGATGPELACRLGIEGGVLTGIGSGVVNGQSGDAVLMADVDLTNLDELPGTPDGRGLVQCLEHFHAQDGPNFVSQLRGAFGIALWIPSRRRLVLAADRLGFRRLYYAVSDQGLAFGSRVKAPLALPGLSRELDADAVYAYLNFGTVTAPQSIYRAVRRLAPGQILVWENGRVSIHQYWDVVYSERRLDKSEAASAIYGQAAEAVRQTLTGLEAKDTGAFLSGGTDSSVVVGLMSRLTGERVPAFSIGFQEERYNELEYAELAARHFDAAHYSRIVTADESLHCLPDIVGAYDEPFGNNSALPAYLCARYAREAGVRVLLAGDGGDEIFGGNERYRREGILARYHRIPRFLRRGVIEPAVRRFSVEARGLTGKARRYVERASAPNPDRFYASEFFVSQNRHWLLDPGFLGRVTADWPLRVARGHFVAAGRTAELNRLLHVDLKITLADNDLFKVVRTAEMAGVSVRFPLLHHPLVEFMATIPARYKVRGTEKRHIFKRAFRDLLPAATLAKVKHGFGLPTSDWLKQHPGFRELGRDTLLSRRALERGYFAPGAVEELFRLHETDHTPFYGDRLWVLLMLELWHQRHGDGR